MRSKPGSPSVDLEDPDLAVERVGVQIELCGQRLSRHRLVVQRVGDAEQSNDVQAARRDMAVGQILDDRERMSNAASPTERALIARRAPPRGRYSHSACARRTIVRYTHRRGNGKRCQPASNRLAGLVSNARSPTLRLGALVLLDEKIHLRSRRRRDRACRRRSNVR